MQIAQTADNGLLHVPNRRKERVVLQLLVILSALMSGPATADAADLISQWRGTHRDGVYDGGGLLKQWPDNGPAEIWSFQGLGAGHGTVVVAGNRVYVVGMPDSIGVLFSFDLGGKLVWQLPYGREWTGNYPGSRNTPTVVGDLLYLESGMGVVYCFDRHSGKQLWSVDILQRFGAQNIRWGMAENLLIDGERLICTPGGPEHNVVALDRFTGKTVWTSKGYGEPAAYCSPILLNHNGTRLIVTMTAESIIGIDADDGSFYWRIPQYQGNKIHANTPLYFDGRILCSSSSAKSNSGIVLLDLAENGKSVEIVWRNEKFRNLMGGNIIKDGYSYGAQYRKKAWCCLDLQTGDIRYTADGLGDGVIIWADGLFYCYSEQGEMALVDADPNEFRLISSFEITKGSGQHWAHPVIHNGRLYVRHGDVLMAYNIQAD
jgi:outer membrane protein assembly factor BamB